MQLRIPAAVFVKKSHGLATAERALHLLGFRDEVVDMKRHYVYVGVCPASAPTQAACAARVLCSAPRGHRASFRILLHMQRCRRA